MLTRYTHLANVQQRRVVAQLAGELDEWRQLDR